MDELIDWHELRSRAPFALEAFQFVREGLAHTVAGFDASRDGPVPADDGTRHVTGQELCVGLRSYAVERYGLLARTVLRKWGVTTTEDFGKIVYAMVDAGLMRTSDQDSLDDFRGVYDFGEAFEGGVDAQARPGGLGRGGALDAATDG
ncbi:MAG: Minf_1886 family protein [Planctomycetota bacterium]